MGSGARRPHGGGEVIIVLINIPEMIIGRSPGACRVDQEIFVDMYHDSG